MYYPSEASAKSVWDSCTWISQTPGSSLQCSMGLILWGTQYMQLSLLFWKVTAPRTLQSHVLETNCTTLKVKKPLWALRRTFSTSCECAFPEVLLTSLNPFCDVIQTPPNFLYSQQDEILQRDHFCSVFYKHFSLTCQKPRLRRLARRRWHPQARTPSGLSNPCLCLQLWTLPLTPFLL